MVTNGSGCLLAESYTLPGRFWAWPAQAPRRIDMKNKSLIAIGYFPQSYQADRGGPVLLDVLHRILDEMPF
jgi:hypothetical protein